MPNTSKTSKKFTNAHKRSKRIKIPVSRTGRYSKQQTKKKIVSKSSKKPSKKLNKQSRKSLTKKSSKKSVVKQSKKIKSKMIRKKKTSTKKTSKSKRKQGAHNYDDPKYSDEYIRKKREEDDRQYERDYMETRVQWIASEVKTFADMQKMFIKFLKGQVPGTPLHPGALHADTVAQRKDIIKLNQLGCITVDSQDGLDEEEPNGIFNYATRQPQPYYRLRQRAYFDGYMQFPTRIIDRIANFLHRQNSILFVIDPLPQDAEKEDLESRCSRWKEKWNNLFHIPLTCDYDNKSLMSKGEECSTNFRKSTGGRAASFKRIMQYMPSLTENEKAQLFDSVTNIFCVDLQWGRPGFLVKTAIKALEYALSDVE